MWCKFLLSFFWWQEALVTIVTGIFIFRSFYYKCILILCKGKTIVRLESLNAAVPLFSRQNQLKDQQQQEVVSLCQLPDEAECLTVPRYKRDLVQKLKILRQELSQQQPQAGHCRIEVSREEIFEVSQDCSFVDLTWRGKGGGSHWLDSSFGI